MDNDVLKSLKEFSVSIYGSLEQYNDVLSKGRCRIFYKGANRNGSYITDEFAEQLISSLPYTPVKGVYNEGDYTDHGYARSLGRIYGIVPENPNVTWETHEDEDGVEREYACADVLLFTAIYEEANEIIGKSQSMELYDKSIEGDYEFVEGQKYFVFKKGCFLGLQVLGDEVEPCFEGAAFFTLYESLSQMVKKIDSFSLNFQQNRQGGNTMPKINFKLSDDQKFEMLWTLLNPNYNEENNWTVDYSIMSVYDEYAVCRNYAENCFERVYYEKNNENDSCYVCGKKKCYIVDVTEEEKIALDALQKINGGCYNKVDENFTAGQNAINEKLELEHKVEELDVTISTLTTERDEAKSQFTEASTLLEEAKNNLVTAQESLNALQVEKDELLTYKKGVEDAEKQAIIDSYSDLLSEELRAEYAGKLDEFTAVDLDKELAYAVKTTNPTVFSKKANAQQSYVPKDEAPKSGLEAILSKYAK